MQNEKLKKFSEKNLAAFLIFTFEFLIPSEG
jgi:hypothetical protein